MKRPGSSLLLLSLLVHAGCSGAAVTDASYPACSALNEQCLDDLRITDNQGFPFIRNYSPFAPNTDITNAIIVIHGSDRDAGNYFQTLINDTEQAGVDKQTMIIAPHFQCRHDRPRGDDVAWQCSDGAADWSHGGDEQSGAVSSFAVIDRFIAALADKTVFPNLKSVVVTGLSAGGQFTQRYAAFNAVDPFADIAIRYVVISPSSYVYLDSNRISNTGAFAPLDDIAQCPSYDDYHYGLANRSGYVALPSVAEVRAQYVARDVSYFVGDADTLANAAGTDMDTSCAANAQGIDRRARAVNFSNVMRDRYAAHHPLTIVPGCEHSRSCMYYSLEVRGAVFAAP